MVPVITSRKKRRINVLPFKIASLAPISDPKKLKIAIGMAKCNRMWPLLPKKIMEPVLVARFTNLAWALAFRKSNRRMLMKNNIKKLPAPGPIKPS